MKQQSILKRVLKKMWQWFYKYSGLKALVLTISCHVLAYKLRLRMIPVSYKFFLLLIGFAIGSSTIYINEHKSVLTFQNEPLVIVNPVHAEYIPEVRESAVVKRITPINELADLVWLRESTRGKNNYSKCEAIGKINGIGYGIPGDGRYMCFDSHEEEMTVLAGWLTAKRASGMSDQAMLCLYSGSNYKECKSAN